MTYLSSLISNVINIISILGNAAISVYAVHIIKTNSSILYDFDVSANCKTIYTYNMIYTGLSGLYVIFMSLKLLCNICNTGSNIHWKSSSLILMCGVSMWGYKLYTKVNTPNYCNGIYDNHYLELRNLMEYQLLSFAIIQGVFIMGKILICMIKRSDAKAKKTDSLKLETSTSGSTSRSTSGGIFTM